MQDENDYDGFAPLAYSPCRKFGLGVIVDAKVNGEHAHLHINFGKEGMKWLDTKFAKLEEAHKMKKGVGHVSYSG